MMWFGGGLIGFTEGGWSVGLRIILDNGISNIAMARVLLIT